VVCDFENPDEQGDIGRNRMLGRTILHYKIIEELGRGGMGIVYKAQDTKLDRLVALKFLPQHLTTNETDKARFLQEAKAASAINHPNVCVIYDLLEQDGQQFIVMEYVEGKTLRFVLEAQHDIHLPIHDVIHYATQIAGALQAAHEKGVVHRDIKSENIMVNTENQIKVMDFGLAKLKGALKLTKSSSTLGTVAYMSPEQIQGQEVDARSDIFSFGVVLYEMLTGQLPFKGDYEAAVIYAILNEEPDPVQKHRPDIMPEFFPIINRTLQKKPENRYQSMNDLFGNLRQLQAERSSKEALPPFFSQLVRVFRRPVIIIPTIVMLIMVFWVMLLISNRNKKSHWAKYEAIPEIKRLADNDCINDSYNLAVEVEKLIPDDPKLIELWPCMSRPITIDTDPQDAIIYWEEYTAVDDPWIYLGKTPIDSIRLPIGLKRFKIEKEGFQTVHLVPNIIYEPDLIKNRKPLYLSIIKLDKQGTIPDGMVRVYPIHISRDWQKYGEIKYPSFLLDQFEVMNKKYKVFVDSGGYRKKVYWKHPFIKDGQILSWEEAMSLFIDRTGRPGPATWEVGDYPPDRGNFPVTGVSWYEAYAYAEFMGKHLPTVTHWRWAAGVESGPHIIPLSNVSGDELAPAGSFKGMGPYGTYDMAGNAREWCWNQLVPGERRFILGGGWNDPDFIFSSDQTAIHPFDRSATNGFRCMKILEGDSSYNNLAKPVKYTLRNIYKEKPVSDQTFDIFLRMFSYSKTDLNEALVATYEHEGMKIEKISFDASYGNDHVFAYLFLPDKGSPPFQTVVFFPGNGVIGASPDMIVQPYYIHQFDFIIKSGRAVLHPVYVGTFERSHNPPRKMFEGDEYIQRDFYIMCAKDLCRSLDYLEKRPEIDCSKLAYYGFSWGAERGPIMVHVGKRFQTAIFCVGGFWVWDTPHLPEVDIFHYVPRLKLPVLMLNGKYDHIFPYKQSQIPLYDLLGTPDEDKRHFLDNTSHNVGRDSMIREILAWLDKYLGPVD
jgi:serine/threonine protein kinase/dienelactone hydrolase